MKSSENGETQAVQHQRSDVADIEEAKGEGAADAEDKELLHDSFCYCEEHDEQKSLVIDDSIYCLTFIALIEKVRTRFQFEDHLRNCFFKCTMIYCIQIMIVAGIVLQVVVDSEAGKERAGYVRPTAIRMVLRLLCCYLFHLGNFKDMANSFRRLKFLNAHPEKFDPDLLYAAVLLTFFQFSAVLFVETVNLVFLCRQAEITDLLMNYVAFAGVSELDNLYIQASDKIKLSAVLLNLEGEDLEWMNNMLTVKANSRIKKNDQSKEDGSELGEFKQNANKKSTKCAVCLIRCWYALARFFYKTIYFYLYPYLIVPLSYILYDVSDGP